jgi:sulfate transport system permease protein
MTTAPRDEPRWVRRIATIAAVLVLLLILVLPLAEVFAQAFVSGAGPMLAAITDPDALSAIRLTLLVAAISVAVNTVGGVAAAWCIARFHFPGRTLLLTLIELPFSVSPVISGLVWVLLFGARGWFGPALQAMGLRMIFAVPGLVLATLFVTFPFVMRQILPLLEQQGRDEEEAAITLGAGGLRMFWAVTLPNIRWALLQGVLLCNARAMGEFGAVSVVSGHIRGRTNTMPLHVEVLYNDFQAQAAFSVAALLALLSVVTLLAKLLLELRTGRRAMGVV